MEKSMTYRRPISGRAAVECSDGKTFVIERRRDLTPIVMGTMIDRLHDYETLGTPEYLKKLVEKDKLEKAKKLGMNSIFGGYGRMLRIGEEDQMKAITDLDITKLYPTTMFTPDRYIDTDIVDTESLWPKVIPYLKKDKPALPEIDRVIFNAPATIVFWKDDTKTVVKANNGEPYDPEKGLAMAMVKKVLGNEGSYYKVIRKALDNNPHNASEVVHVKDIAAMYHCLKQCEANVSASYSSLVSVLNNKKATKADLLEAIELSVGHLGELLDDGGPVSE